MIEKLKPPNVMKYYLANVFFKFWNNDVSHKNTELVIASTKENAYKAVNDKYNELYPEDEFGSSREIYDFYIDINEPLIGE
jgi:hypothetical protein